PNHPPVGACDVQRGHEVDIPATALMNLLTSATTVVRSSAGLSGRDFAVCVRLLLAPLAADRAPTIRKPWSAPGNSTTDMPGALPIAARISSGVPKLSLLPCMTSL